MSTTVVASPGTTLFQLAARYLNDATQWTRIAVVNNIADPFLTEIQVITIPAPTNTAGENVGS